MRMRRKAEGRYQISATMKMADLIDMNFDLVGVLARIGISFGFGEDTVEEVCARHGVNTNTFLLICIVYTFDNYVPTPGVLREADLKDIVTYLRRSHDYYTQVAVTYLAESIEKMIGPCDSKYQNIIRSFFSQYKNELARHFEFEETQVFPYVMSVLEHREDSGFTILQYEENHTNVEEKLEDLKNILLKYLPPQCDSQNVMMVLSHLHLLEKDLQKHTLIEDDILVPVVNAMERDFAAKSGTTLKPGNDEE